MMETIVKITNPFHKLFKAANKPASHSAENYAAGRLQPYSAVSRTKRNVSKSPLNPTITHDRKRFMLLPAGF